MEDLCLIQALQDPSLYPDPVIKFQVIETHLSWVILTGLYAYKIKKPVRFTFVDFTTLEKRHFYCQEELRLNKRLAPDLYLEVLAIHGSIKEPKLTVHSQGEQNSRKEPIRPTKPLTPIEAIEPTVPIQPIIEWAIKMRQFDQKMLLSHLAEMHKIEPAYLKEIAKTLAIFHQKAPQSDPDSSFGSLSSIENPMLDNFLDCHRCLKKLDREEIHSLEKTNNLNNTENINNIKNQLNVLQKWSYQTYNHLKPFFVNRKKEGFIRECHGDCHLGNMVLIDHHPIIFDCIEFNDEFRWIDTINEIAFLTMDCQARSNIENTFIFLNTYLEMTGDYLGLKALRFYQVYRAMVRAKIALLTPGPDQISKFLHYLHLSQKISEPSKPSLLITYGLSGSGKTCLSKTLAPKIKAIHIRSDLERKRMNSISGNLDSSDSRPSANGRDNSDNPDNLDSAYNSDSLNRLDSLDRLDLYSKENKRKIYDRLWALSKIILEAGYSVIVDATFLMQEDRDRFFQLSLALKVPFIILHCIPEETQLKKRIHDRLAEGQDPSEATISVLEEQKLKIEPLNEFELTKQIIYYSNN